MSCGGGVCFGGGRKWQNVTVKCVAVCCAMFSSLISCIPFCTAQQQIIQIMCPCQYHFISKLWKFWTIVGYVFRSLLIISTFWYQNVCVKFDFKHAVCCTAAAKYVPVMYFEMFLGI